MSQNVPFLSRLAIINVPAITELFLLYEVWAIIMLIDVLFPVGQRTFLLIGQVFSEGCVVLNCKVR